MLNATTAWFMQLPRGLCNYRVVYATTAWFIQLPRGFAVTCNIVAICSTMYSAKNEILLYNIVRRRSVGKAKGL